MKWDRKWTKHVSSQSGQSALLDQLGIFGARYLLWIMVGIMFFFFYTATDVLWLAFLVPACAWVVALILEYAFQRPRPFIQSKTEPLGRPMWTTPSFPSGHATISFAVASLVMFVNIGVGALLLVFAAIVSLSRVYLGVHYITDIIAGAFTGILLSTLFALLFLI